MSLSERPLPYLRFDIVEAARMVGVDVDRVIVTTFFIGSALAGAAGFIFGIYYNVTREDIGFQAGLFAFTAAVLGGIGSIPGAMLGGLVIGFVKSLGTMVSLAPTRSGTVASANTVSGASTGPPVRL